MTSTVVHQYGAAHAKRPTGGQAVNSANSTALDGGDGCTGAAGPCGCVPRPAGATRLLGVWVLSGLASESIGDEHSHELKHRSRVDRSAGVDHLPSGTRNCAAGALGIAESDELAGETLCAEEAIDGLAHRRQSEPAMHLISGTACCKQDAHPTDLNRRDLAQIQQKFGRHGL